MSSKESDTTNIFEFLEEECSKHKSEDCKMSKLIKKYYELNDKCSQILEKRKLKKKAK